MITKNNSIVVLNGGSSSLRFSLYDVKGAHLGLMARGRLEGNAKAVRLEAKDDQGVTLIEREIPSDGDISIPNDAFKYLATWLQEQYADHTTLAAVGHRIAHGGPDFVEPVMITDEVITAIENLIPLSPLQLPHNLAQVRAVSRLWPTMPQVACFDTAFHCSRSRISERYSLPDEFGEQGVKRWGFHGLSHESVAAKFGKVMPHMASARIIVAHLGNSVSLCAMNGVRSADTSTGFSTLDGPPMGTQSGSLDPGVILYLLRKMTPQQVEELLYNKSGLLGISGISSEMRVLLGSDDPRAEEAVGYFVYRVMREIASLVAALGGLDALIFTAGIGENSPEIRWHICKGLEWLGIDLDGDANDRGTGCISRGPSAPSVWVIPSDEEGIIAEHTMEVVSMLPTRVAEQTGGRDDHASI